MKKARRFGFAVLSLVAVMALGMPAGCLPAASAEVVEVFDPGKFPAWFAEEGSWRTIVNRSAANDFVSGFVTDASGKPGNEDIAAIMNFAVLADSARGRTPWYMVVIADTETQNAITQFDVEGIARATSDGTVTVLVFTEWALKEEYRTDDVMNYFPHEGYINAGILAGYANVAAVSLGYSTRIFMTLAPGGGTLGERLPEAEQFLEGTYYTWGSTGDSYSTENMKFAMAIVIGTLDETVESGVTTALRPQNWSVWIPGEGSVMAVAIAPRASLSLSIEDGVHTGSASGFSSTPIVVQVTVAGGAITEIEVLEHSETEMFMQAALLELIPQILEKQSLEGIHAVSGATQVSNGIIHAVADALNN